ncbi:hypothetical protein [Fredinandcohnia quinoae]|uniref:RNA polymerase subunit sigma-70 n=1 Tax=Fredinandcohnia quinoae TaxID=2918902 RepID=A0AAW5E9J3_9BACI|nr:hypothetical protein [Fredinandcohnia sp. SECRCQ15]MCH1627664.1 hypothetical protein [Fredinandcohnia sp. SECRCQ15]
MRYSEKSNHAQRGSNQMFGVDFHDFIEREQNSTYVELASEFGISVKEVRQMKKKLERS